MKMASDRTTLPLIVVKNGSKCFLRIQKLEINVILDTSSVQRIFPLAPSPVARCRGKHDTSGTYQSIIHLSTRTVAARCPIELNRCVIEVWLKTTSYV